MKKEQLKIAEVLYELGMSYEVIEKMTSITPSVVQQEVKRQKHCQRQNRNHTTNVETRQTRK